MATPCHGRADPVGVVGTANGWTGTVAANTTARSRSGTLHANTRRTRRMFGRVSGIAVPSREFDVHVRNRVPWMRLEDYEHQLDGLRNAG